MKQTEKVQLLLIVLLLVVSALTFYLVVNQSSGDPVPPAEAASGAADASKAVSAALAKAGTEQQRILERIEKALPRIVEEAVEKRVQRLDASLGTRLKGIESLLRAEEADHGAAAHAGQGPGVSRVEKVRNLPVDFSEVPPPEESGAASSTGSSPPAASEGDGERDGG